MGCFLPVKHASSRHAVRTRESAQEERELLRRGERKRRRKREEREGISCSPLNDLVPLQAIVTQGGWQNYS